MNEKHRELAENIFEKVSMAMTEHGILVPLFFLILPDESLLPVIIKGEEYNLQEYAMISNDVAKEMKALAMVVIAEQWMVSKHASDADLAPLLNGQIRASEHPDSKSYLTLMYLEKSGHCESMIAEIHQDPLGTKYTKEQKWLQEAVTNILQPW